MKHLILVSAMLVSLCVVKQDAFAQAPYLPLSSNFDNPAISFDSAVNISVSQIQQAGSDDSLEGGISNGFKRWVNFWDDRVVNNVPTGMNKNEPANIAYQYWLTTAYSSSCSSSSYQGDWKCIGPYRNYYQAGIEHQGRVDAIWVSPNDTNHILVGSNGGGLWRSRNGGQSWHNITDGVGASSVLIPGTMGISHIAVDPLDSEKIAIASGMYTLTDVNSWTYGLGMLYTTDGGSTWTVDGSLGTQLGIAIRKLAFKPSSHQMIGISGDFNIIYKSSITQSWLDITPSLGSGVKVTDFEFSITDPDVVVFSTSDGKLWVYDISLTSWNTINAISPSGTTLTSKGIDDIGMTSTDSVIALVPLNNGAISLWKTAIAASSWREVNPNTRIIGTEDRNIRRLSVSPANENILYFGCQSGQSQDLWITTDGGQTFTNRGGNIHGDVRHINIYSATNTTDGINDVIYVGTDGGIVKKRFGNANCISITGDSLCITQFHGMSNTEGDDRLIIGGAQDNGIFNFVKQRTTAWQRMDAGDGYRAKFGNNGDLRGLATVNYPGVFRFDFNTSLTSPTITGTSNPPDTTCSGPWAPCANTHRPIQFTSSNTAYIAHREIYRGTVTGTGWTRTISTEPKEAENDQVKKRIVAFRMAPNDSNMMYMSYCRESTIDPRGASNSEGRLYRSTNAFSISPAPTWVNITPKEVASHRIMDIAIAPQHPERIWVALGNIDYDHRASSSVVGTDTVERVFYSADSGKNWKNVSIGLPALPANRIVYQEGSDDVLYLGTDVGVFKWNKAANKWECFNNGMPPNVIMELEINYCAGKLRAGTYGRGIWETDILNSVNPGASEVIASNTTWSTSRIVTGGVHVKPGATLTIKGTGTTIRVPKSGIIKVDSGAYLIVDSAVITNGCEGCMWEGIQVGGRYNINQLASQQGRVWLTDATIEHAKNAISNSFDGYLWNTGGIVRADRTKFLNNKKSVVLMNYSSSAKYAASFRQCTFEVTEDYKDDTDNKFQTHVDLNRVDGPTFYGCNFYYRLDPTGVNRGQGYGIRSTDAGFSVKPHCASTLTTPCSNYVRSNFKGFLYGVYADRSVYGAYSFTVDRATFDSCSFGIRMYNLWGIPVITRDTFHVGHGVDSYIGFDCHRNVGIFSTACGGYVIQDNDFKGYTDNGWQHAQHQNWGTLIEDGGELDNQVYRCSFRELDRANVSWGKNASPYNYATSSAGSTWTGLRYVCNTFANDTTDIHVEGGNYRGGIAAWQGNFTKPAGNSFGSGSHNHLRIINTPYPVYFYQNSGTQNPVNPSPGYSNKIAISNSNSCPVLTDDWNLPLGPDTKVSIKSTFAAGKVALGDLQATYAGYIDGGSTSTLVSYINGSTSSDAVAVKATLLSYSPYLSTTTIKAVADKDILSKPDLITVLEANPDLLRYPELLNYLKNEIPNPLDNGQINTLIFASQDTSARTILEANMSKQAADNQMIANFLLADMQLDSANTDIDSIPVWYNNINSLSAEYAKVGYYTGRGDYTNAASVLDGIPAKFSLTGEESTELENYIDLWTIIKDAKLDGRSIHQLNSTEIANLATLNEGSSINDRVNVGTTVVNLPPDEPIRIPCVRSVFYGWNKQGNNTSKNQNSSKRAESIKIIRAYPNPADEKVVFDYTLPSNVTGSLSISITNMVGQKVKELPLNNTSGRVQWDTKSVPPGVYVYKVYDRKNTIETGKLIISR